LVVPIKPILYKNIAIINHGVAAGQGLPVTYAQPQIPSWNTPGRPKKAKKGTFGFNLQTNSLEYWMGSRWLKLPMKRIKI
jgi:hypothetical protein